MNKSSVGSNLVQAKPRFSAQPAQAAQKKSQIYTRVGYRLQLFTTKIFCALKKMAHFIYIVIQPQPAQAKPRFSAQPAQVAQKKSQIYTRVGYWLQLSTIKFFCTLQLAISGAGCSRLKAASTKNCQLYLNTTCFTKQQPNLTLFSLFVGHLVLIIDKFKKCSHEVDRILPLILKNTLLQHFITYKKILQFQYNTFKIILYK